MIDSTDVDFISELVKRHWAEAIEMYCGAGLSDSEANGTLEDLLLRLTECQESTSKRSGRKER